MEIVKSDGGVYCASYQGVYVPFDEVLEADQWLSLICSGRCSATIFEPRRSEFLAQWEGFQNEN